jgi:prepilin-type N-terminal cleavage/methylation domain-containing protein
MNGDLKSPAFSLIELLMVMTMVGLFAVLSVPRFNEIRSALKAKGAAKKMMADLRYAQSAAMGRNTNVTVFFNDSGHSYYARYEDGNYLTDPFSGGNFSVSLDSDPQFRGAVFNSSFNGTHSLKFDRVGRPYDANNVILFSGGTVNLVFGYNSYWVNVTAGTGLVTGN